MPAKGTRKLTDQQKVDIVIAKKTKPRKTDTYGKLARDLDVAEITVRKTSYESLNSRQRDLYNETIVNLKYSAISLTAAAMEKSQKLVEMAESIKDLPGVVAAGKFGYELYRLEVSHISPTASTSSPEATCRRWVACMLQTGIYKEVNGERVFVTPSLKQALTMLSGCDVAGVSTAERTAFVEDQLKMHGLV